MSATLVQFPAQDIRDVPQKLRTLAEDIEAGRYDDAHNLAWVIDCGSARVECGLLGAAAEPGLTAHYLFAVAQRKLESPGGES